MITSQQGDLRKIFPENESDRDGVGGHYGTHGGANDGDEGENGEDKVAAP
jgi:hypothetical protein